MKRDPILLTKQITVGVSVAELADAFSQLADDQQAEFFLLVGKRMNEWSAHAREMQLLYMAKAIDAAGTDAWWLLDELEEWRDTQSEVA